MKYLAITSKHHDGICLWPSKQTDYHIGNTPFKRNVLKKLSEDIHVLDIHVWGYSRHSKAKPGIVVSQASLFPRLAVNRHCRFFVPKVQFDVYLSIMTTARP